MPVPLAAERLTGITTADLAGAPDEGEALAALYDFVGEALVIAHNAPFDRAHLAAGACRSGLPSLGNVWFDTLDAALLLFPEFDSHALAFLAEEFGCRNEAHRALPDAETAAVVFRRLCARAAALGREERELFTVAGWPSLQTLDGFEFLPDAPTPPLSVEQAGDPGGKELAALPVRPQDWAAELAVADDASPPGLAARLPGYRPREGQVQLAAAAADVLTSGGIGVFEAGTGSGKSLAYLLPAAFHSAARARRVVVSTRTKALQRQLAAHELPLVAQALPSGWRWTILMGRENYLCRRRLDDAVAVAGAGERLDDGRVLGLAYLVGRARRGEVDLSALPYRATRELPALAELGRELRSSRTTCSGRHCAHRRACFWRQARGRAEEAHLVCVNHALLLTGIDTLPPFEDVVIDEAHLLYQEATDAFSLRVDSHGVRRILADLKPSGQRPLASRLRAIGRGGNPSTANALSMSADTVERFLETAPNLALAVGQALLQLARRQAEAESDSPGKPSLSHEYDLSVWLTPGMQELPEWDMFAEAAGMLHESFAGLATAMAGAAEALPEEHREHATLAWLSDEAGMMATLLDDLPRCRTSEHVVWAEIDAPGKVVASGASRMPWPLQWSLTRSPLTPARQTREILWERLRSAILTSATLTVNDSFAYFRGMTGLDADLGVTEKVFPSPFDFRRQAVLVLEHDPDNARRRQNASGRLGQRIKELVRVTGGRMLVLFTNRRDMHGVATAVGEHVEADGVLVLAQGLHGSAATLSDEFRAHGDTVLFGVDTLWTGQDFPGDTLVCLVIAKLPFPRQDPLFRARCLACDEAGQRWFEQFYLPEAVLRFRQGFGRLIRTETDTGVVVVLDPRLSSRNYRRAFIGSLPDLEVVEAPSPAVAAAVEEHLRGLASRPPG